MAKGLRIPASPEYRRKVAREAAAHKRAYQRWLKDPVAQAEHAAACARHQERCKQERLHRARAEPGRHAAVIRAWIADIRHSEARRPARSVLRKSLREPIRDQWRMRRAAQADLRLLEAQS
jgi:hypothetical protein